MHFTRIFLIFTGLATVLAAQEAPATVFLLRHAERSGAGLEDPITKAGQERAELLSRMFGEVGVTRIYVSEFLRTRETAAPLAKKLGIEPTVVKGGDSKAVAKAFRELAAGSVTLAVRHSGEIERTLLEFGPANKVPQIEETEYDRLLILTLQKGKLTALRTLRYGAASKEGSK